ncbi:Retrovirus-related Pol polyprotein from transposon TNT 1-94, partial [Frankliniella fusca]
FVSRNNKKTDSNFVPTCYECKEKGHKKPDCPKIKKLKAEKLKEKKKQQNANPQPTSKNENPKNVGLLTVAMASGELGREDWYFDSCCSRPVSHRDDLADFVDTSQSREILVADSKTMKSSGVGDVTLTINNKGLTKAKITDVTFCPDSAANLLSVHQIAKKGNILVFDKNGVNVFPEKSVIVKGASVLTGSVTNGIYKLDRDGKTQATNYDNCDGEIMNVDSALLSSDSSQELWHKRMGHLNYQDLSKLKKLAEGVDFVSTKSEVCIPCIKGKHSQLPFQTSDSRATKLLELVHSDIGFPEKGALSYGGATCFVTFTDDFSRMSFVYFLKRKSDCFSKFKEFKLMVENQTECKIKRFRSDNGKEYDNIEMKKFCAENGILLELTVPYTPQQNGVSERHRTIVDRARTMLIDAKLDKKYWAEAVNCAIYLKNRSPTVALDNEIPLEVWSGNKVDLSNVRVFGCKVMAMIPKCKRKKFDDKSEEMIMVGYCEGSKGYRVAYPNDPGHVIESRNVKFIENKLGCTLDGDNTEPKFDELIPEWDMIITNTEVHETVQNNNENDYETEEDENEYEEDNQEDQEGRQPRIRKKPAWHDDYVMLCDVAWSNVDVVPSSGNVALKDPKWKLAMEKEYNSLVKNGVWELVERPEGVNVIKSKWVFKVKKYAAGNYDCHKARLVARGYSQKKGIDYEEVYSPVVRPETLRLIMCLSNELSLEMEHVDITTAFLNGVITEKIYMEQPEGFVKNGKVCALKKSIYGLKQASRAWNENIRNVFKELGFVQSVCDPCVFVKREGALVIYICLYVDDIFVFTNWDEEKEKLYQCLESKYEVKFLGKLKNCLGMRVQYDKDAGILKLDQSEYVSELLKKFEMNGCHPKKTPMSKEKLPKFETKDETIPYQECVGSLMYLAVSTRPDIMYTVSKLSQYNKCYRSEHWSACKRALRYLAGTKDLGLVFTRSGNLNVECYVDASYACDESKGYSHIGYVVKLGGSVFAWQSKRLKTVTLSSTEAEYLGLTEGIKESMYVRNVLEVLGFNDVCVKVFNDNEGAMSIAKDEQTHKRTKHINLRSLFIKEKVRDGLVSLDHLGTNDLVADVMTKPLGEIKHHKFTEELCLKNILN